jgi:hypothetical protein
MRRRGSTSLAGFSCRVFFFVRPLVLLVDVGAVDATNLERDSLERLETRLERRSRSRLERRSRTEAQLAVVADQVFLEKDCRRETTRY